MIGDSAMTTIKRDVLYEIILNPCIQKAAFCDSSTATRRESEARASSPRQATRCTASAEMTAEGWECRRVQCRMVAVESVGDACTVCAPTRAGRCAGDQDVRGTIIQSPAQGRSRKDARKGILSTAILLNQHLHVKS